ncbi:meiotic nuclear division protein 1 [Phycomyces nitens]|nr:meiotic nuclear division protein 1 [Phycomyces nitens]
MSKKGISAEEKRKRLEEMFLESGDFFQAKEVEKLGSKRGIVSQSIKEVLQSLVDDGLVMTDKIGASNYFWSFPLLKKLRIEELESSIRDEDTKAKSMKDAINRLSLENEDTDERRDVLARLELAEKEHRELLKALQPYKDNDPALMEAKKKSAKISKEAANRWTDNIWTIRSHCINKLGVDPKTFNDSFGISEDFDSLA